MARTYSRPGSVCLSCSLRLVLAGFFPDRDILPGRSILDEFDHAASATGLLIVVISADFHLDHLCRLLLNALLMSGPLFTYDSYDRHERPRQLIVPIVRGECQLPFGLICTELIRCHRGNTMQSADMLRLRRLLKSNALSSE